MTNRAGATLGSLTEYFLRLGTFGFGGPIALTAAMQRDLVQVRGWFTLEEYKEGLTLAQLAPGPLAAQLAIYLGWARYGVWGATLAGLAFVCPSLLMVLVLSACYLRYGELSWMQGAFYGIGAAVIAIVARGAGKLLGTSIGRDPLLWAVVIVNAVVVAWTEAEILWVLALSGLVVMVWRTWSERTAALALLPWWLVTGLHGPASSETMIRILGFFTKAAVVVFGSGLAVVPFLHGGAVREYGWLTERQFLDAVAVSMITPGPVVITVAFIGYLVAGPLGGLVAAIGMFLPTYLAVVLAAPSFHRITGNRRLRAAVDGVTAAATGAIAGAVVVLGRRAIFDAATIAIALGTLLVLIRARRVPEPMVIVAAGILGVVLTLGRGHAQASWPPSPQWRVIADVPLPGKAARFDYQSLDPTTGRLWIAHMGAGEVLAFDVQTRQVVARVPNMPGVTGVRVVPALQRVFAALSASHEVAVLDSRSGQVLARVRGGRFPDGLAYAPQADRLFVSDEYGRQELVIDVGSSAARRPIPLGGEAGNTQYDSAAGRIWVAVQTRNELVAIDPLTDSVVDRVPVPGIERPHGFYVDPGRPLIYVTGEGNGRVGVLDLRTKQIVGTYPVGDEPDVLAFDPDRNRLFIGTESGAIAAFDLHGDSLAALPRYTAPHAHSVAVDPASHLVYVPLENVGGRPVLRILTLE